MSEKHDHRSFLRVFWAVLAVVFVLVGGFNWLVDPFGMFGAPRLSGFNALKPEIGTHVRMAKAYQVRFFEPGGIILGTSRADVGLNPEHPGWAEAARPVYNLAISSGRIDEMYGYLRHAQAHGPLKQVVLGLDFMMFNPNWRHERDYSEARLSVPGRPFSGLEWLRDGLLSLFSMDGLESSMATIEAQGNPAITSYFSNGARDTRRKWGYVQKHGGHYSLFLENTKYDLTAPEGWSSFGPLSEGEGAPLETLRKIAGFCRDNGIDLRVFISPLHASKLEVIWQVGLGPVLEQWKRDVTRILARAQVPLWDFSGYNSITTEPFPALGDRDTQMKNYWEGSHYKKHIGDLILARLFGRGDPGGKLPDDFGVQLKPQNIEEVLRQTRRAREAYRHAHQRDIGDVRRLVQETGDKRGELMAALAAAVQEEKQGGAGVTVAPLASGVR